MKRLKIVSIAAILAILLAVSAYAAIVYYSANITNTGNITAYEAQLFRLDTGTQVTNIPWGNLAKGVSNNTDTIFGFTQQLVIKNTGDYDQYVGWQLNGTLPAGVTLTCQYWAPMNWFNLPEDTYTLVSPGAHSYPIRFVLTTASDAPRGAFNFNINIVASDTP